MDMHNGLCTECRSGPGTHTGPNNEYQKYREYLDNLKKNPPPEKAPYEDSPTDSERDWSKGPGEDQFDLDWFDKIHKEHGGGDTLDRPPEEKLPYDQDLDFDPDEWEHKFNISKKKKGGVPSQQDILDVYKRRPYGWWEDEPDQSR